MAVITPNDCPKSVRNCCDIKVFGGVFVVNLLLNFLLYKGFRHRTESNLVLFPFSMDMLQSAAKMAMPKLLQKI